MPAIVPQAPQSASGEGSAGRRSSKEGATPIQCLSCNSPRCGEKRRRFVAETTAAFPSRRRASRCARSSAGTRPAAPRRASACPPRCRSARSTGSSARAATRPSTRRHPPPAAPGPWSRCGTACSPPGTGSSTRATRPASGSARGDRAEDLTSPPLDLGLGPDRRSRRRRRPGAAAGRRRHPSPSSSVTISAAPKGARGEQAKFIEGPGYSLALPAGWEQSDPPDGAAFAAGSEDGLADATLWIEEDPELSFREFEQRSLAQLERDRRRPADRRPRPGPDDREHDHRAARRRPRRRRRRGADQGDAAGPPATTASTSRPWSSPARAPETGGDVETLHASLRPDVTLAGLEDGG